MTVGLPGSQDCEGLDAPVPAGRPASARDIEGALKRSGIRARSGGTVRYLLARSHPRRIARRWAVLAAVSTLAILGLGACSGNTGASGPFPVSMDDAQVSVGQQVYATNCAACHGQIGERPTLPGAPSHAEDGHTWHHDDRQLFGWILDGPPRRTVMPTYRGVLSDQEVIAVLAYMKSEWPREVRDIQTRQTGEYERQLRQQQESLE